MDEFMNRMAFLKPATAPAPAELVELAGPLTDVGDGLAAGADTVGNGVKDTAEKGGKATGLTGDEDEESDTDADEEE